MKITNKYDAVASRKLTVSFALLSNDSKETIAQDIFCTKAIKMCRWGDIHKRKRTKA